MKKLTRKQFFKKNPPETRNIFFQVPGEEPELLTNLGEEIICDRCNALIEDDEIYDNEYEILCEDFKEIGDD